MTKLAHITSRPQYELGDRVLGLCGKEFKVKVLWKDLPIDKPICRFCVDAAMKALTEADVVIGEMRRSARRLSVLSMVLSEIADKEIDLDTIAKQDAYFKKEQEELLVLKAAEDRLKTMCTCTWTSPEMFTEDPDCPIHGGEDQPIREIEDVPLPTASDFSGVQGVQESDIQEPTDG
jgi:hypothetical protein